MSRRKGPVPYIAAGLVAALGLGAWLLSRYLAGAPAPTKPVVQEIQLIRPPPPLPDQPPPPPPPPEEKIDVPEPDQPQPEPTPSDEPPPGEQLGLDAEGSGGNDGFGLIGRKGGRDLLASGSGAYSWYAGLIKDQLLGELSNEQKARAGSYTVTVRVWVATDGSVRQIRLASSTGDSARDRAIEAALSRVRRLAQPPPPQMPQPVTLRIVSRV